MKYFEKIGQQGPKGLIATQIIDSAPAELPIIPKKSGSLYKKLIKKFKAFLKRRSEMENK